MNPDSLSKLSTEKSGFPYIRFHSGSMTLITVSMPEASWREVMKTPTARAEVEDMRMWWEPMQESVLTLE